MQKVWLLQSDDFEQLGALGANLGALGANLGAFGANLGALGSNLGALGAELGATWTSFARSNCSPSATWIPFGPFKLSSKRPLDSICPAVVVVK